MQPSKSEAIRIQRNEFESMYVKMAKTGKKWIETGTLTPILLELYGVSMIFKKSIMKSVMKDAITNRLRF